MNKFGDTFETLVRFSVGGLAVCGCYIVSLLIPMILVAGLFAAFPAVMVASVALSGHRDGNALAGEVAKGALSGMIGCTLCVLAGIYFTKLSGWWVSGVVLALPVWFAGSILAHKLMAKAAGQKHHEM